MRPEDEATGPLSAAELELLNAYWRAANYLSVGQIYLLDNPLLTEPLRAEHVKRRLLGHWGTTPGLNLIYVHLNRLTYRRRNHQNLHVRGYIEEGTTTTPFGMVMLNNLDRFHLVADVIDRVPSLGARAAHVRQRMVDARLAARAYTREHGEDDPEIRDWTWPY
nr:hypothetical protein [Frankia tisae]